MFKYILAIVFTVMGAFQCTGAHAARVESGNVKVIYIETKSGKQVSALEADRLATNDEAILGCSPYEKVCNERTGKCTVKKAK